MSIPSSPVSGILNYRVPSKEELHRSYMPFLKNGGIFIPTEGRFKLNQELFLLLVLPQETERHPVAGTVAWWNPTAFGFRPKGVGIQFIPNATTEALRHRIEVLLAGYPADLPTYTM